MIYKSTVLTKALVDVASTLKISAEFWHSAESGKMMLTMSFFVALTIFCAIVCNISHGFFGLILNLFGL